MWWFFISDIPAYIVLIIIHIIAGLSVSMVVIFVMLSIIRCLICHEVVWYASLNENIVALIVNITSITLAITIRIVVHVLFFGTGRLNKLPFLSGEACLCDINKTKRAPVLVYILFTASLLLEFYIGMLIKRLSCIRLIPVTLGHLYMIACMYILTNYQDCSNTLMQALLIAVSLQFMYVLRQKEYTIELVKKSCNVLNDTVVPVNENSELNDFGIFVGPQGTSEPIIESDLWDSRV